MRRFLCAAVLASVSLSACGRSPATTFLALTPVPPVSTASYRGPPVRVPFLRVPLTLDRPEFVRQVENTILVSDFDRWAAPLGRLARDTLIQDLQSRLPSGKVLPPDARPAVPETRVEATVMSFTATGGEAVMTVSYLIVRPTTAKAKELGTSPETAVLRVPLAADNPTAQVQAWSDLLGQLADHITSRVMSG